jgi:hypothetical protein
MDFSYSSRIIIDDMFLYCMDFGIQIFERIIIYVSLYVHLYIEKQVKIRELFCCARLPLPPPYFAPGNARIGQTITK